MVHGAGACRCATTHHCMEPWRRRVAKRATAETAQCRAHSERRRSGWPGTELTCHRAQQIVVIRNRRYPADSDLAVSSTVPESPRSGGHRHPSPHHPSCARPAIVSVLGYWVGVRRPLHLSSFLTAPRVVLPQDASTVLIPTARVARETLALVWATGSRVMQLCGRTRLASGHLER